MAQKRRYFCFTFLDPSICEVLGCLFPVEMDRPFDVFAQALMHRTGFGGAGKQGLVARLQRDRQVDMNRQLGNAAERGVGHVLFDFDAGAGQIQVVLLRLNAKNGQHATSQRGGDQVGRRKRFAFAAVVDGRIGVDLHAGRSVVRLAAQFTLVNERDVDGHGSSRVGLDSLPYRLE
jgi:hypothetical protein